MLSQVLFDPQIFFKQLTVTLWMYTCWTFTSRGVDMCAHLFIDHRHASFRGLFHVLNFFVVFVLTAKLFNSEIFRSMVYVPVCTWQLAKPC